jgi:hypothetical protein
MTPVWNLDNYSNWDIENRKTLQYQILSGNVILDDKGTTLKLNPSVMDVYSILTNPSYIGGRLNSYLKIPYTLMTMNKNDWETDEEYAERKRKLIVSMIPIAGAQMLRWDRTKETGILSPSMFGKTSIPQERAPYQARPVFRKREFPTLPRRSGKKKYFGFHAPSYKQLRMQSMPFAYSGVKWRGFLKPYPTRVFSSIAKNPRTSNLRQGVNPKGEKLRHLLMWLPTDKYNLKFKLKWINKY